MPELSPPAHDKLKGVILRLPERDDLVIVAGARRPAGDWEIIREGTVFLCYGLAYLHQPVETLLVQWAYDDFRREYHGDDALRFVIERGDSYPRADVMGRQVSTGKTDQRFLKEIDISAGLRAIAYPSLDSPSALGRVGTILWLEPGAANLSSVTEGDKRMTEWMHLAVNGYIAGEDTPRWWTGLVPSR